MRSVWELRRSGSLEGGGKSGNSQRLGRCACSEGVFQPIRVARAPNGNLVCMEIVRLADRVGFNSSIEDAKFVEALIVGPAVVVPLTNVSFHNCTFEGTLESIFIEIDPERPIQGLISLRTVIFERCEFRNVSIAATRDEVARGRARLTLVPRGTQAPVATAEEVGV